jgi:rhodanese-related sulfurtransferase
VAEIQAFASKYSRQKALVVYCASSECHLSHQMAETLVQTGGFTDVTEMPGGYAEYLAAQPRKAPAKP